MTTSHTASEAWLELLRDGCHRACEYDEAEGGLINHCTECQRKIVTALHSRIVMKNHQLVPPPQAAQRFTVVTHPYFEVAHENWFANGTTVITIKRRPPAPLSDEERA